MVPKTAKKYLNFPDDLKAKLNQNEVQLPPPSWIFKEAFEAAETMNYYQTEWLYDEVRRAYARYAGVDWERVWIAPGSDLFYDELFLHTMNRKRLTAPRPTYFAFELQAEHVGFEIVGPRLRPPSWKLDMDATLRYANTSDFVYIDNPNNPTGSLLLNEEGFFKLMEGVGERPVLIDEAYYEFSGVTFKDYVGEYENLSILRTMSKAFRLAGLRVTFLIVGDSYVEMMHKETLRFRVPTFSLLVALAALRNPQYALETAEFVNKEKKRLSEELKSLGFEVYPSWASYILVRSNSRDLAERLARRGVLIKDVSWQLEPGFIRITIGSRDDNDLLLEELAELT